MQLTGLLLLVLLAPFIAAVNFQWSSKFVYNTDETDSTMAILLRDNELQVCFADLSIPDIPSGRCNLGHINGAVPNITFQGADVFQTVNGTDPFALRFNDQESVIAYTHGNDSQTGNGQVFVARAEADYRRMDFFPQAQFDPYPNDQSTMVHLHGNTFALCYSMGYNDEVGGCRIGEIRADHNLFFGPEVTYYNGTSTDALAMVQLGNNRFLICYEQGGNSMKYWDGSGRVYHKRGASTGMGTCQIANVVEPGHRIQYSPYFDFSPYGVDEISLNWIDATNRTMLICFNNYNPAGTMGSCVLAYIDEVNGQITYGSQSNYCLTPVDETNAIILPPGVAAATMSVLVCYVDLNTEAQEGACTLGTVGAGNQVTWSYKVSYFNTVTTDEINLDHLGGETILLCYVDTPGGSCKFGRMSF